MKRKVFKWIGDIIIVFLVCIMCMSIFMMFQAKANPNKIPSVLGFQSLKVLTGSMEPALMTGDMVVIRQKEAEDIEAGDVLTFKINGNTLVTHRVAEIINEDNQLKFRTKGDANNTEDAELVNADQIIGTMVFKIPNGGKISDFARTGRGFILLIILPLIILIASELSIIWKELKKGKEKETGVQHHTKA